LGLGRQLAELVRVDAFNEESFVERDFCEWRTMVGSAQGLKEDGSEDLVFWGDRVGGGRRSEAETFGNGSWQEGRVRFLGVDGGSDGEGEGGDFEGSVEERELVARLIAPDYFFHLRVVSGDELRG
jgi:hypothetical protein